MKKRLGLFAALLLSGLLMNSCSPAQTNFLSNTAGTASFSPRTATALFTQIKDSSAKSFQHTKSGIIVITDRGQIAELAKQQSLGDPASITKITYEFRASHNVQGGQQEHINTDFPKQTTKIYNVKDLGSGFSDWEEYDSDIFDGPAESAGTDTRVASCSYSANPNVDAKLVEAAVKFDFISGENVSETHSITIPANHKTELRIYTNYEMWSYDIGYENGSLLSHHGSGTAQRPVGLIYQQIER